MIFIESTESFNYFGKNMTAQIVLCVQNKVTLRNDFATAFRNELIQNHATSSAPRYA